MVISGNASKDNKSKIIQKMDLLKSTVLTNLQRGNIEAQISQNILLTFFEKVGQGENFSVLIFTRSKVIFDFQVKCQTKRFAIRMQSTHLMKITDLQRFIGLAFMDS